ncbi:MAG: hypothetical protein ABEK16_02125 [Candidatus Nanohalobium sp.]
MAAESEYKGLEILASKIKSGEITDCSDDGFTATLYDGAQSLEIVYDDGRLMQYSRFGSGKTLGQYESAQEAAETIEESLGINLSIEGELTSSA